MPIHHVQNYVEHLKSKPEPVRRQYALLASAGLTAIIALGWLAAFLSSDALALAPRTDVGSPARDFANATANEREDFTSLLGAAGAFRDGSATSLTVVNAQASSTLDRPEDETATKTVIPF